VTLTGGRKDSSDSDCLYYIGDVRTQAGMHTVVLVRLFGGEAISLLKRMVQLLNCLE